MTKLARLYVTKLPSKLSSKTLLYLIKLVEKRAELLIKPPEKTGLYLIEPEELEKYWKQKKLLIKPPEETGLRSRSKSRRSSLKKTLPYWKNWKKTERLQHEPEELEKTTRN